MANDHCPSCGRTLAGGAAACRAEFDAWCAAGYGGAVPYARHRLTVDAYALQHPGEFCASARSLAAHLTGVLVWAEYEGDPALQRAVQQWLGRHPAIVRPADPPAYGAVTLADVLAAGTDAAREVAIDAWARSAWEAWAPRHAEARAWLAAAREGR